MNRLLTQLQRIDELAVGGDVGALEVVKELTAAAHHLQKTAAGVMILHVFLEVTGQTVDAGGEKSHLDFGRTRVAGSALGVTRKKRRRFVFPALFF